LSKRTILPSWVKSSFFAESERGGCILNFEQSNLQWLIDNRSIVTYFQPIVSIKKQAIIGVEALSRGLANNGELIMPQDLFSKAVDYNKIVDLDRLCREVSLENYKKSRNQDCFLFLNLDSSIIDRGVVGSGQLINVVTQLGLSPSSIVIEITESQVYDIKALVKFIKRYKAYGFLFALDDVGSDSSNLARILHVRPDIIKVDRELIKDIPSDYYKQELFKSLVTMAKKTGSLVIAEGVETHEEAVTSLELGANFLQGYYISKPIPSDISFSSGISKTVLSLATSYCSSIVEKIREDGLKKFTYNNILDNLAQELATSQPEDFESKLRGIALKCPWVQCYYILDKGGIQITETVDVHSNNNGKRHGMFQPACRGTNQSQRDYYLFIHAGFERYMSEPYISLANGYQCITGAALFKTNGCDSFILCIDFKV